MPKYTVAECFDSAQGAGIWRDGSEILRTTLMDESAEKHTEIAKFVAKALEEAETRRTSGSSTTQRASTSSRSGSETFDIAWMKELLADAMKYPNLSGFEEDFVRSIKDKIDQYAERTFISPKQMEILKRIEDKIHGGGR